MDTVVAANAVIGAVDGVFDLPPVQGFDFVAPEVGFCLR